MPAVLVGAKVDGRPNYMTAAWCSIACLTPPMIVVALNHTRHTLRGIKQNDAFSINVPSAGQVIETDYCGNVSGAKVDKSKVFESFYGKLKSVPMIKNCPINLECRLFKTLDCGSHELCVGEIIETYVAKGAIQDSSPDVAKVDPMVYSNGKYYKIGEYLADAFAIGKAYNK
jgi:flavin reductase (DIM6/NTAB) family NADH-FMN oxidoreductase RutF